MKNYDDVTTFWVTSATPNSHDVFGLFYKKYYCKKNRPLIND